MIGELSATPPERAPPSDKLDGFDAELAAKMERLKWDSMRIKSATGAMRGVEFSVCEALLRVPSTEGRSVCLCWAPSKPKGLSGDRGPP